MRHQNTTLVAILGQILLASFAFAGIPQDRNFIDREITKVIIRGLDKVDEGLVRNNIRLQVGDPYDPEIVKSDARTLNRLGVFESFEISIKPNIDGDFAIIYEFKEHSLVTEIKFNGNTLVSNSEIETVIPIKRGSVKDAFLINKSKELIKDMYKSKGHYLAEVLDQSNAKDIDGPLIFKIIEGPRVRIKSILFQGNRAFTNNQLSNEIETETALILLRRGELDRQIIEKDVATLDFYYRSRGYLDIRVDYKIELGPQDKEAKVIFLISEGPLYRLRKIKIGSMSEESEAHELVNLPKVFSEKQIFALMHIQPGDPFTQVFLNQSRKAIEEAYGHMGYVGTTVNLIVIRPGEIGRVDLIVDISEGERVDVGIVSISGNILTKDNVIRRHVGLKPGHPLDGDEIKLTEDRIKKTRLFSDAKVRLLKNVDEPSVRDVLVEVKERRTGNLGFGVGFGSDSGAFGQISYRQDNFDVNDYPQTFEEFLEGKTFIGAGQKFSAFLMPGTDVFNYGLSITEPYFLESRYALSGSIGAYRRKYREYEEERSRGSISVARSFGDIWKGSLRISLQEVELSEFDATIPDEIRAGAGPEFVESVGFALSRNTINAIGRPDSGSNLEILFNRFGFFGGEYEFNQIQVESTTYFALSRDFLDRPNTLKVKSKIGHNFGGYTPTYERFYLGGSSFRGFDYREIAPRGTLTNNGVTTLTDRAIGGDWLCFLGAQYETPLVGETVSAVGFIDTGVVNANPSFDNYRVTAGMGIRLYIPAFGQAPIAFDFAFPVVKESSDDRRVFNFNAELPF